MPLPDPTITKVNATPFVNGLGQTVKQITTTYMIGPHGPFTITVDEDAFKPEEVRNSIQQMRAKLEALGA